MAKVPGIVKQLKKERDKSRTPVVRIERCPFRFHWSVCRENPGETEHANVARCQRRPEPRLQPHRKPDGRLGRRNRRKQPRLFLTEQCEHSRD